MSRCLLASLAVVAILLGGASRVGLAQTPAGATPEATPTELRESSSRGGALPSVKLLLVQMAINAALNECDAVETDAADFATDEFDQSETWPEELPMESPEAFAPEEEFEPEPPVEFAEEPAESSMDDAPEAAEFEFQYDPALPLDMPMDEPMEPEFEAEPLSDPVEPEPLPTGPLSTLPATPDPFFGSVHGLLNASSEQPLFPRHTIRPPSVSRLAGGTPSMLDATGELIALSELVQVGNGESLTITTERSEVTSPGKVVLLVDGRAMLLSVTAWQTGTVEADMPPIRLRRPTPARLYLSNAEGLVFDGIDFLLLPAGEED